jgi:hydrogenase maturation protease
MARVLIAGIGNVFFGDDGFGVEVARRLAAEALPPHIEVVDAGIAGLHLAYRLLEGYELFIAVDAVTRGQPPGTVYVLEPALDESIGRADAHSVDLRSVLASARAMGGQLGRVLVVGCEPLDLQARMGLSAAVEAAIEPAARRVRELAEGAA